MKITMIAAILWCFFSTISFGKVSVEIADLDEDQPEQPFGCKWNAEHNGIKLVLKDNDCQACQIKEINNRYNPFVYGLGFLVEKLENYTEDFDSFEWGSWCEEQ